MKWKMILNNKPPEDVLLLLWMGRGIGRWDVGYFRNGIQMKGTEKADWVADAWMDLPSCPNSLLKNYIE